MTKITTKYSFMQFSLRQLQRTYPGAFVQKTYFIEPKLLKIQFFEIFNSIDFV